MKLIKPLAAAFALTACATLAPLSNSHAQDPATSDPLPRRAWLGAVLAPGEGGVLVRELLPGSSAEAAGLKPGDILKKLGETTIENVPDALRVLRALRGGASLEVELIRDEKPQKLTMPMKEWPREPETDAYRVEYGSVHSSFGRLRTITFIPKAAPKKGEKHPALLIIQGLGAATLDYPRPVDSVDQPVGMSIYRTMADALAREGYIVARVDKGGCGDSEGDPAKLDFPGELDGYRQAMKALKGRNDVDGENIFIFGHSMGGVFGPMLGTETPVKGVAAYGTALKPWIEYLAENHRRQTLLAGTDAAELDTQSRGLEKFNHEFLVNKKSPEQVLKELPDLGVDLSDFGLQGEQLFGRHYTFFQQLQDVNLAELWSKQNGHVLAAWGMAEFVSGRDDHELIASIVNKRWPGHGTFKAVPESDHGMSRAASPEEAMTAMQAPPGGPSRFNPAFLEILKGWMNGCLEARG